MKNEQPSLIEVKPQPFARDLSKHFAALKKAVRELPTRETLISNFKKDKRE